MKIVVGMRNLLGLGGYYKRECPKGQGLLENKCFIRERFKREVFNQRLIWRGAYQRECKKRGCYQRTALERVSIRDGAGLKRSIFGLGAYYKKGIIRDRMKTEVKERLFIRKGTGQKEKCIQKIGILGGGGNIDRVQEEEIQYQRTGASLENN